MLHWKFMVGRQRRRKTNLPSRNTKGKAEQINNTTSQLTGTFHQGTSTHFTNNTYFPVSKGQGDKWEAQRSHRKCVIILRIKNRPYSPGSGLTGSSLQTPLCISPLLFQPTTVSLKTSRFLFLQQRTPHTKGHLGPEGNTVLILKPQMEQ